MAQTVKRLPTMLETRLRSSGGEDPLEKDMATHSSILAWKSPWEEPGRLQSMGSQSQARLHFTDPTDSAILRVQLKILFYEVVYSLRVPQPCPLGPWRPHPLPGPGIPGARPAAETPSLPAVCPRSPRAAPSALRASPPCQPVPSALMGAGDPGQPCTTHSFGSQFQMVSSRPRASFSVAFPLNMWARRFRTETERLR